MSKPRRGALFVAILSAGASGVLAAPAAAETLADAIALAYQSNPTLQAQRGTQRALDETYVQARSGYRPTLSVSASATYREIDVPGAGGAIDTNGDGIPDTIGRGGTTIDRSGSTALVLNQPVYTGGRVAAAVSAAQADILTGRENLRRVEAQILAQVITAYVDVRRDQEALRIRIEDQGVLQRQLDESRARFEVGEITRTDVALSEARYAAAQSQAQVAQAQLAISRASYTALVGQSPGDLAPEPSLAALLPATVDGAFDVATENNAQIRAAEYAEQASRARVAGARAERMPSVSLQGRLGFSGEVQPIETDTWSRNITGTASVSVPLFSGGLTSSRIRQQVERNNTDRITIEVARRAVLQTVTQAWSQLISSRANITSTAEQVRAARIAAEGTRQEQQVGLRTTLDVLNAEQELRQAELSQIAARHDEYVAAAAVVAAMGRLEAKNLTPTVPQYDPKTHFRGLRITWGWVPWEEPIAIVDGALTPKPVEKPVEGAIVATPPIGVPAAPIASTPPVQ
ncbi:MAG: TolC family outer membrane protein [Phenylobacterium sp.]|uniref:TolC family outer membrane protein n=1 Tax=Phenylobacterium sp. TaxID=1871053 RepID=UPI00273634D5|nr:TolC family outer membrane protein [Phenylobacterium sp.]MDP3174173.1 TolC family outer membrane protein [Phenylobacterium sp.]